jgi:amidase
MKDDLIDYDGVALGELVRKKEVKPTELLEVTIQRIEKINPKLNAVIHKMYDQARETAANWTTAIQEGKAEGIIFCGVPFLLKGLILQQQIKMILKKC